MPTDTKKQALADLLREILAADRRLLLNRGELIKRLDDRMPQELQRDYSSLKKALVLGVGEQFFTADEGNEDLRQRIIEEAKEELTRQGTQATRADLAVDILRMAMDWDRESVPDAEPPIPSLQHESPAESDEMTDSPESPLHTVMPEASQAAGGNAVQEKHGSLHHAAPWCCVCGAESTGSYCGQCGRAKPVLESASQVPSPAPVPQQTPSPPVQSMPHAARSGKPKNVMILVGVMAILSVAAFLLMLRSGGDSPQSSTHATDAGRTTQAQSSKETPLAQPASVVEKDSVSQEVESDASLGAICIGYHLDKVNKRLGNASSATKERDGQQRFQYPDMEVVMDHGVVTGLVSKSSKVATKRGIHQGSSFQEVVAAYGNPPLTSQYNGLTLYEYRLSSLDNKDCLLRFAVKDGFVDYISARIDAPQPSQQETSEDEQAKQAKRMFLAFHQAITDKQYGAAYNLLSESRKRGSGDVSSFAAGYGTTISSKVVGLTLASSTPQTVVFYYNLEARDRYQGRVKVQTFGGTVTMVNENGAWRIGAAESKKTGEHME